MLERHGSKDDRIGRRIAGRDGGVLVVVDAQILAPKIGIIPSRWVPNAEVNGVGLQFWKLFRRHSKPIVVIDEERETIQRSSIHVSERSTLRIVLVHIEGDRILE